jgi:branched-chain amino acid transport system ATP-binding protein
MMLTLEDIHTYYGKIRALNGISLHIEQGELATLIGANGAGKSTTLKTIVGWVRAKKGVIKLNGEDITRLPTHKIIGRGVTMVPEGREVFGDMSLIDNLEIGAFLRKDKKNVQKDLERIFHLFPILEARRKQSSKSLSGGEQQMLAISRGLMNAPSLMLLDEPSLGLAPLLVKTIFETLKEINKQGVALFLVEQNALMALKAANNGYVLEKGSVTLRDKCTNLLKNEDVQKTYLGMD